MPPHNLRLSRTRVLCTTRLHNNFQPGGYASENRDFLLLFDAAMDSRVSDNLDAAVHESA